MYEYEYNNPFGRRSNIAAGIIKIATEKDGLIEYYKKVFDAAAQAHKVKIEIRVPSVRQRINTRSAFFRFLILQPLA